MEPTRIEVGTINCTIDGDYPKKALDKALSYYPPKAYNPNAQHHWDEKIHLLMQPKKHLPYFPTGLLSHVCEIFEDEEYEYKLIKPTRHYIDLQSEELPPKFERRSYQTKAVYAMLRTKRGILKIPTGGGKTLIAASCLQAFDLPCIYLVHTSTLLEQTRKVFEEIFPGQVGVVGGGEHNWKKITIGMVQSLMKMIEDKKTKIFDKYEIMICDECHHLSSGKSVSWYVVARHFKNAWIRFGMSATPVLRKRGMLLVGTTGPVIAEVSLKELQQDGYIAKADITFYQYQIPWLETKPIWTTVYKEGIVECLTRNKLGCKLAIEQAQANKVTMIFVEHIAHGKVILKLLRQMAPTLDIEFLSGQDDRSHIAKIKQDAKQRRLNVLIVTRKLFGEGVDIPAIDALINLAAGESVIVFTQMFGRGLRISEGKTHLVYIDFLDRSHEWLTRHAESRMQHCRKLKQTVEVVDLTGGFYDKT